MANADNITEEAKMNKREANKHNKETHEIMVDNYRRSLDPNDPINRGRCVSIKLGQAMQAMNLIPCKRRHSMINGYMESGKRGFRLVSHEGEALTNWCKHRADVFKEYKNKQDKKRRIEG